VIPEACDQLFFTGNASLSGVPFFPSSIALMGPDENQDPVDQTDQ
jgi:hypothetical protein